MEPTYHNWQPTSCHPWYHWRKVQKDWRCMKSSLNTCCSWNCASGECRTKNLTFTYKSKLPLEKQHWLFWSDTTTRETSTSTRSLGVMRHGLTTVVRCFPSYVADFYVSELYKYFFHVMICLSIHVILMLRSRWNTVVLFEVIFPGNDVYFLFMAREKVTFWMILACTGYLKTHLSNFVEKLGTPTPTRLKIT